MNFSVLVYQSIKHYFYASRKQTEIVLKVEIQGTQVLQHQIVQIGISSLSSITRTTVNQQQMMDQVHMDHSQTMTQVLRHLQETQICPERQERQLVNLYGTRLQMMKFPMMVQIGGR